MPYTDTVGDIIRVTAACTMHNKQTEETNLHMVCMVAGPVNSLPQIANQSDSLWLARFLPHLSSSNTFYGSKVHLIKSLNPYLGAVTYSKQVGGDVATSLPTQVRWLTHLHTEKFGRRMRGRMYGFTPSTTAMDVTGEPSPAFLTAMASLMDQLMAGFSGGGSSWLPCIAHRPPKNVTPAVWTYDLITQAVLDTGWATQRRSSDQGRENPDPW